MMLRSLNRERLSVGDSRGHPGENSAVRTLMIKASFLISKCGVSDTHHHMSEAI